MTDHATDLSQPQPRTSIQSPYAGNSLTASETRVTSLASAIHLALAFAAVKLLLHCLTTLWITHLGWGYFRDEFYYLACGRHLAWGFVDHGPLVAVQARLAETLFGHSLLGLRLPSALAGAARVFLTGLLCYQLGGRRAAQSLAMLGVLVAPQYLGIDSFLSMNSFESLFWMSCLLALILLQRRLLPTHDPVFSTEGALRRSGEIPSFKRAAELDLPFTSSRPSSASQKTTARPSPLRHNSDLRLWLLFGLSAGLGLLNKPSMTFFLIALGLALLLTSTGRTLLLRREALAGIALLILIALPNLLWQVHNHWPTLEFLQNDRAQGKNAVFGPLAFLNQQVQTLNPLTIFLWLPGLLWLLRRSAWRWLGLTYVFFLVSMLALHAKDYYVTPIYPILFAAGGIAWQNRTWRPFGRLSAAASNTRSDRLFAFPLYQATLVVSSALLLPMAIPVLSPQAWLRYTAAMHLRDTISGAETSPTGPFPQFFADRFGWQEEVDLVNRAYQSLSPADRARVLIFGKNYGEAGAIDILSSYQHLDLPPATSGQNSYYTWGLHGRDPNLVIAVVGDTPEQLSRKYRSVTVIGRMNHPYAMPFEHKNVYLLRDRLPSAPFAWRDERFYY